MLDVPQVVDGVELLGRSGVGRVVFTRDALPDVATLNYAVLGPCLYFRTTAGTAVAQSVSNAVVAFNADCGDHSVTVTGRCRVVPESVGLVRDLLDAWAPGLREEFFALDLALVEVVPLEG